MFAGNTFDTRSSGCRQLQRRRGPATASGSRQRLVLCACAMSLLNTITSYNLFHGSAEAGGQTGGAERCLDVPLLEPLGPQKRSLLVHGRPAHALAPQEASGLCD